MRRPSPLLGVLFVMCVACAVRVRAGAPEATGVPADSMADVPAAHAPWVFDKGMHLRLLLQDGSRIEGDVLELAMMAASQYRSRCAAWRDTSAIGARLPLPGDTVRVVRRGKTFDRLFAGFGPGGIYVREHPDDQPRLIEYDGIASVAMPDGEPVPANELADQELRNALPSPRVIVLGAAHDTTMVLVNDIERVESGRPHGHTRDIIAALLGVAVFAVIVYAITQGCQPHATEPQCEGGAPIFVDLWLEPAPASAPPVRG